MKFLKFLKFLVPCLLLVASSAFSQDMDYFEIQRELDAACELARQQYLAPARYEYVQECIDNTWRDAEQCERFYSDYGARTGNRAPLFYDLPECVEAFEFRKSYRRVY